MNRRQLKKPLLKTALAAVLLLPILALPGCPDGLTQGAAESGCMKQAVDSGVVNAGNLQQIKTLCATKAQDPAN